MKRKNKLEEELLNIIQPNQYRSAKEDARLNRLYLENCVHEAGHLLAGILCEQWNLVKLSKISGYILNVKDMKIFFENHEEGIGGMVNYSLLYAVGGKKEKIAAVIINVGGILFSNEFYSYYLGDYRYSSLEVMSDAFGGKSDMKKFENIELPKFMKHLIVWGLKSTYKDRDVRLVHLKLINTLMKSKHVDFRQVRNLMKKNKTGN